MTKIRSGGLGRKALGLLTGTWCSAAMSVLSGILIARILGAEAVGALAFSVGLSGVVLAALGPGFLQAHTKRIAEGLDVSTCLATLAVIKLALYAALGLVVLAVGPWRHALFGAPALEAVFLLLFAGALASNFSEIFTTALIAKELAYERAAVLVVSRGARLLAILAVLAWAPDVRWVAATFALEGVVELAGSAWLVRTRLAARLVWPTRDTMRAYWVYARPLLVTVPIGILQDSVDRVLVARWAGLEAGGYYHIARGLWELLAGLLGPPQTFLFTRLSSLFARRSSEDFREARRLFASASDKVLFITVPAALLMWFFAGPVLVLLYGPAFAQAETATRVLVIAGLVAALVNPYTQVVYALDAHARFVPIVLVRTVLYLGLLVVAVPSVPVLPGLPALGLAEVGGAIARVFAIAFPAWVYVRWTRELARVPFEPSGLAYLAGFAVAVVVFHGATALATALGPGALVVGAVLGAAAYAGWLRAFHPATPETLAYCLGLLRPARHGESP